MVAAHEEVRPRRGRARCDQSPCSRRSDEKSHPVHHSLAGRAPKQQLALLCVLRNVKLAEHARAGRRRREQKYNLVWAPNVVDAPEKLARETRLEPERRIEPHCQWTGGAELGWRRVEEVSARAVARFRQYVNGHMRRAERAGNLRRGDAVGARKVEVCSSCCSAAVRQLGRNARGCIKLVHLARSHAADKVEGGKRLVIYKRVHPFADTGMSLVVEEVPRTLDPGRLRSVCPSTQHAPLGPNCVTGVLDSARPGHCLDPNESVLIRRDDGTCVGAFVHAPPAAPNCMRDFPEDRSAFLTNDGGCAVPMRK